MAARSIATIRHQVTGSRSFRRVKRFDRASSVRLGIGDMPIPSLLCMEFAGSGKRPFATDGKGSRLCKNVWRFFQIAQKGQQTPTWFGAAKIRYANFSELIYSEVQFCFYTASAQSGHMRMQSSGVLAAVRRD